MWNGLVKGKRGVRMGRDLVLDRLRMRRVETGEEKEKGGGEWRGERG